MRKVAQPADFSRKPRSAPVEGRAKGLHDFDEEPDDPRKLSLTDTLIELAVTLGGILGVFFLIIRLAQFLHAGAP